MRSPSAPSARIRAVHLLALSAFGIAQPMLQILGDSPVYFAVQGFHALDVVLYSVALVLAVPALAMGVELIAALVHAKAAVIVHQLFVVILTFLILIRALHSLPFTFTVIGALAIAIFTARVYRIFQPARTFLTICALAPILFLVVFLLKVPLSALSATEPPAGTMPVVNARTSVVLVVFDEFAPSSLMTEAGEIDSVRYPNFAALARSSTWYRNATTVYDATDWAVPAILTGQIPGRDQLPVVADHPQSVFTLFGRSYDYAESSPMSRRRVSFASRTTRASGVARPRSYRTSSPRSSRAGARSSPSSTFCSRTSRCSTSPPVGSTRVEDRSTATSGIAGPGTDAWSTRPTSGTCSRSDTSIACWVSSSGGSSPQASGTIRSSS